MTRTLNATAAACGLVLALAGVSVPAAAQSGRVAELTCVAVDTMALPGPGTVTGIARAGADTTAFLLDVPDSLATTGRREVHLLVTGGAGETLRDEDFTGVLDRALAWTGDAFFACGDAPDGSSILYRIVADSLGALVVEKAYTAPGHRPMALAWDGRYLWCSDRDSGRLDRFDPEVGEFTRFVASPGFSPVRPGLGRGPYVADRLGDRPALPPGGFAPALERQRGRHVVPVPGQRHPALVRWAESMVSS